MITEPEKDSLLNLFFEAEVLEIIMDIIHLWLTFTDNLDNFQNTSFYDAGMLTGKSFVNAGFSTYLIIMEAISA